MASKTAILAVRILTDAKQGQAGLDTYASSADKLGARLDKLTVPAAAVLAALTAIGLKAVSAASDLQQATGAVEAVFGAQAAATKAFAADAADNVGLAASQYSNLAAVLGAQLKNLGMPMDRLSGQTDQLIRLGADLAATYGGDVSDAVEAVTSLLRGETDPIERYGVSIKQVDINARIAAKGLDTSTAAAQKNAQATAALSLLYDQTADAAGQFGREADTLAGQQARANANWEDAKAALGEGLLPVMTAAAQIAAKLGEFAKDNAVAFSIFAVVIGGLAAGILLLNGITKAWVLIQGAATAAQWLLNIALDANPIGLVIIAIGLLIGIIVLLVTHWEEVSKVFVDVWSNILNWFNQVLAAFGNGFAQITAWWQSVVDGFTNGFNQIVAGIANVINWFNSLFGIQSPGWVRDIVGSQAMLSASVAGAAPGLSAFTAPSQGLTAPSPFAAPVRRAGGDAGQVVNITIQGAVDPNSTARQIKDILRSNARSLGTNRIVRFPG